MRLSTQSLVDTVLSNIGENYRRLIDLQRQVSSGRKVSSLSDDPAVIAQTLGYRSELDREQQFVRNIDASLARLEATETSLGNMNELLQRAREVAVYAANATVSSAQRDNLASEIRQLVDQAAQTGNAKFNGQYIFAGTATTTVPFSLTGNPPTGFAYNGNSGAIERQIDDGARVAVSVAGDTALGSSFTALIGLHTRLTTPGADITLSMSEIDAALDAVLQQRGQFGAKVNRFERSRFTLEETQVTNRTLISKAEDVDIIDAVTKLKSQEAVYQAALMSGARVVQNTLLDFLR